MHWRSIGRLFGILLMFYSLGFVPSLAVSLHYWDGCWEAFAYSLLITLSAGYLLWKSNQRQRNELSVREGFLVVTLFWVVLGMVGALPLLLGLHITFTDAVFESISGFTTTGATVIIGLDSLPPSIQYHRQQIQWLGGMGIIVLAVAVLPLLGVGGMQLYRAEASGVAKEEKLTPRIAETARLLWAIYTALTSMCAAAYWLAGMSVFDAVCHAFTTVATGGFSTHDASFAYFDSPVIELIAVVFMLAGGINFAIHFFFWKRLSISPYVEDPETRAYVKIFIWGVAFVAFSLIATSTYGHVIDSIRYSVFQVTSILTSTGYTTADFSVWPLHIPLLLAMLSFTGGCAGSTAGGMKVLRILLLGKLALRQLFKLAHPRAVAIVKLRGRLIGREIIYSALGFVALYIATSLLLTVAMLATGLDLESSFGAVMATINLLGPGLGEVATSFVSVSPVAKWLGIIGMLLGRLEVFTLLILFLPAYWRH